jgi:hypothetical protein
VLLNDPHCSLRGSTLTLTHKLTNLRLLPPPHFPRSLLVLFTKHLSAFHRNDGLRYALLAGPGEVITFCTVLLICRGTLGIEWFISLYFHTIRKFFAILAPYNITMSDDLLDYEAIGSELMKVSYWSIYSVSLVKTLLLPKDKSWSR